MQKYENQNTKKYTKTSFFSADQKYRAKYGVLHFLFAQSGTAYDHCFSDFFGQWQNTQRQHPFLHSNMENLGKAPHKRKRDGSTAYEISLAIAIKKNQNNISACFLSQKAIAILGKSQCGNLSENQLVSGKVERGTKKHANIRF